MNIEKILWNIQKIKIFTDKNNKKELLKFDNKSNQIFSIIRNNQLQKMLFDRLKRSKFAKFTGNIKLGSLGEYETKAIKSNAPIKDIHTPKISINLLIIN